MKRTNEHGFNVGSYGGGGGRGRGRYRGGYRSRPRYNPYGGRGRRFSRLVIADLLADICMRLVKS